MATTGALDDHAHRLLGEAWYALTGEGALPGPIEVTGTDDQLASALPVIPLATAAVGASMLAAARLDGLRRSGHTPLVELDTAHLACAVRSERYVRGDGQLEVAALRRCGL
jgi:hypothetical protein